MKVKTTLFAILLTIFSPKLFAIDYYIVTTDLNVRTGAGTGYTVSYTLKKGEEVEILSKENNWYKIKYLGRIGYAFSKYFQYSRTTTDNEFQTPQETKSYFPQLVFVCLALLLFFTIYKKLRSNRLLKEVTEPDRGTLSERELVLELRKYGVPAERIFHDLYVEKTKGYFSQIDVAVVTEVGIIVFEVKEYSGWIFGSGNQSQWTQVLNYGKQKNRFYNPVMQNNKHIYELRRQLSQYQYIPIFSVIVFYGDCELKGIDFIPNGTLIVKSNRVLEAVQTIVRDNKPVGYTNENEIIQALNQAVANGGIIENQIKHAENIKDMLGKHRVFD